jgi:hypothetical protein
MRAGPSACRGMVLPNLLARRLPYVYRHGEDVPDTTSLACFAKAPLLAEELVRFDILVCSRRRVWFVRCGRRGWELCWRSWVPYTVFILIEIDKGGSLLLSVVSANKVGSKYVRSDSLSRATQVKKFFGGLIYVGKPAGNQACGFAIYFQAMQP